MQRARCVAATFGSSVAVRVTIMSGFKRTQLEKAAERGAKQRGKKCAGVFKSQMCKVPAIVAAEC